MIAANKVGLDRKVLLFDLDHRRREDRSVRVAERPEDYPKKIDDLLAGREDSHVTT